MGKAKVFLLASVLVLLLLVSFSLSQTIPDGSNASPTELAQESQALGGSCGNGLCEVGEDSSTCFIDCLTGNDCSSCSEACELKTVTSAAYTTMSFPSERVFQDDVPNPESAVPLFFEEYSVNGSQYAESQHTNPDSQQVNLQDVEGDYNGYLIEFVNEATLDYKADVESTFAEEKNDLRELKRDLRSLEEGPQTLLVTPVLTTLKRAQVNAQQEDVDTLQGQATAEVLDYRHRLTVSHEEYIDVIKATIGDVALSKPFYSAFNGVSAQITAQQASVIAGLPFVKRVYPNQRVTQFVEQSSSLIGVPAVRNLGYTGKGVTVAVIDTGIDYTHPDFGGCISNDIDRGGLDTPSVPELYPDSSSLEDNSHAPSNLQGSDATYVLASFPGALNIYSIVDEKILQLLHSYTDITTLNVHDIFVDKSIVFLADQNEFIILNLNDPANPLVVSRTPLQGKLRGVAVRDHYAYVNTQDNGLLILDISDLTSPQTVSNFADCPQGMGVTLRDEYAFLACNKGDSDLRVVNISNPLNPQFLVRGYGFGNTPQRVAVYGNSSYIVSLDGYINVHNLTNMKGIQPIVLEPYLPWIGHANIGLGSDVAISYPYAYFSSITSGVVVFNISSGTLSSRTEIGRFATNGSAFRLAQDGDHLYVLDQFRGIYLLNTSDTPHLRQLDFKQKLEGRSLALMHVQGSTPPLDENARRCTVVGGWNFLEESPDPFDDNGHGTHVTGIIAANGTLQGIAPGASVVSYKVLSSSGSGWFEDVISAIEASIDPNQDGDFSDSVDIISMSLGGSGSPDDPVSEAVARAVANGVIVVVAAGNNGPTASSISSPGVSRDAITVGATNKLDSIASFSSRGPLTTYYGERVFKPDLVAPGVSLCSTGTGSYLSRPCLDFQHALASGTSMATPVVSGVLALLLEKEPELTPEEVRYRLMQTALNLGYDRDIQGAGRVDVEKSIGSPVLARPYHLELTLPEYVRNATIPFELSIDSFDGRARRFSVTPVDHTGSLYVAYNGPSLETGENTAELIIASQNGSSISSGYYEGVLYLEDLDNSTVNLQIFYTLRVDSNGPQHLNVRQGTFFEDGNLRHHVYWDTNERAESTLVYRRVGEGTWNTLPATAVTILTLGQQAHSVELSGLTAGDYEYYISSTNEVGITINQFDGIWYYFTEDSESLRFGPLFSITIQPEQTFPTTAFTKKIAWTPAGRALSSDRFDFDGDGRFELLQRYTSYYLGGWYVFYEMNEEGNVTIEHDMDVGPWGETVSAQSDSGDTDLDGKKELLYYVRRYDTSPLSRQVVLFEQTSSTSYPTEKIFSYETEVSGALPKILDMNENGIPEVYLNRKRDSKGLSKTWLTHVAAFESTGDNTYHEILDISVDSIQSTLQVIDSCGDMNHNGKKELILAGVGRVQLYEQTQPNSFQLTTEAEVLGFDGKKINLVSHACLGDLNNNGYDEIVIGGLKLISTEDNSYYNQFAVLEITPQGELHKVADLIFHDGYPMDLITADFTGNGKDEIAVVGSSGDAYVLSLDNSFNVNPLWYHQSYYNYKRPAINEEIAAHDFDGDGKSELVVHELPTLYSSYPQVAVYEFGSGLIDDYRYFTLTDESCFVNVTTSVATGSVNVSLNTQPFVCSSQGDLSDFADETRNSTFYLSDLNQGSYQIHIVGEGSYSLSVSNHCLIDRTSPTVMVEPFDTPVTGPITIQATIVDSNALTSCALCVSTNFAHPSDLEGVSLFCNSSQPGTFELPGIINDSFVDPYNAQAAVVCTSSYVPENETEVFVSVQFSATDAGGNKGYSDMHYFVADTHAPIVQTILEPEIVATGELVSYIFNISDLSGIAQYGLSLNGFPLEEASSNVTLSYSGSLENESLDTQGILEVQFIAPENPGTNYLTVSLTDSVGHSSASTYPLQIDEKLSWTVPTTISSYNDVHAPLLSRDGTGALHFFWIKNENSEDVLYHTHLNSAGIPSHYESAVTRSRYGIHSPATHSSAQYTFVVWEDGRAGNNEIYLSSFDTTGALVLDTVRITSDLFSSTSPRVVASLDSSSTSEGSSYVFWISTEQGVPYLILALVDGSGRVLFRKRAVERPLLSYSVAQKGELLYVLAESEDHTLYLYTIDSAGNTLQEQLFAETGFTPHLSANTLLHALYKNEFNELIYVSLPTEDISTLEQDPDFIFNSSVVLAVDPLEYRMSTDKQQAADISWSLSSSSTLAINSGVYYTKRSGDHVLVSPQLISPIHTSSLAITSGSVYILYEEEQPSLTSDPYSSLTFTTTAKRPSQTPRITSQVLPEIGSENVVLRWTTDSISSTEVLYGVAAGETLDTHISSPHFGTEHELLIEGLLPETSYTFHVMSSDFFGGFGAQQNEHIYATTHVELIQPELPTSLFGQVLYQNQSIAPGVTVTATWIDVAGNEQSSTTKTLSRLDALERNDSSLAGYYFFTSGSIRAAQGTTITLSAPDAISLPLPTVQASPGASSKRVPVLVIDANPPDLTIIEPLPTTYASTNVTLRFSVSEPLQSASFMLNGLSSVDVLDLIGEDGVLQAFPLPVAIGQNTLTVTVTDEIGLTSEKRIDFLVEDLIGPILTVQSPEQRVSATSTLSVFLSDATNSLDPASCAICLASDGICDSEWTSFGVDALFAAGELTGSCSYYLGDAFLEDGTYSLQWRASDVTGNYGTSIPSQLVVDTTGPAHPETLRALAIPRQAAFRLEWDASTSEDVARYTIYRSLTPFTTSTVAERLAEVDVLYYLDDSTQENAEYFYAVAARDDLGNENSEVLAHPFKTNDLTPPTITLTAPQHTLYSTDNLSLQFSVSEESFCSGTLDQSQLFDLRPISPPSTESSNTFIFDFTVSEGTHSITVTCADYANNTASISRNFSVDTQAPPPVETVWVTTQKGTLDLLLSWERPEVFWDISHYALYRSREPFSELPDSPLAVVAPDSQTHVVTQTYRDQGLISEETYYYTVTSIDAAGNEAEIATVVSGTVADLTPPRITLLSPTSHHYPDVRNVSLLVEVNEIVNCSYVFDESGLHPSFGPVTDFFPNIGAILFLDDGSHSLSVSCADLSGNTATAQVLFTSDALTPDPVDQVTVSTLSGQSALLLAWNSSLVSDFSSYRVYRSRSPFNDITSATFIASTKNMRYQDTGLESEGQYYYAVTVVDTFGNEARFVTSSSGTVADVQAPYPLEAVRATPAEDTFAIDLSWSPSDASDFAAYHIYRAASPRILIATINDSSATAFRDTSITSGKTYTYTVTAVDIFGNENLNVQGVEITAPDIEAPIISLIEPLAATYSQSSVPLRYNGNEALLSCTLFIDDVASGPPSQTIVVSDGPHTVSLTCTDLAGNTGTSATVSFSVDTTAPDPVTGLRVHSNNSTPSLTLSWNAVHNADFSRYAVYRSTSPFASYDDPDVVLVTETMERSVVDSQLHSDLVYYYGVTSIDLAGNRQQTLALETGRVADFTAPGLVSHLVVEGKPHEHTLHLSWDTPAEEADDIVAYDIYRSTLYFSLRDEAELIGTVAVASANTSGSFNQFTLVSLNYTDADDVLESGVTYYYGVASRDEANNVRDEIFSVPGTVADTVLPLITIVEPRNSSAHASQTIPLRYSSSEPVQQCIISLDGEPYTIVEATVTRDDGTHTLALSCTDLAGNTGNAVPVTFTIDTTPPLPVTGLQGDYEGLTSELLLRWQASADESADHYLIYRSEEASSLFEHQSIGSTSGLSFGDKNVVSEKTYWYALVPVDTLGNANYNATPISVTVPDIKPPAITIHLPQREYVYGTSNITLTFTVDEPVVICTAHLNTAVALGVVQNNTPFTFTAQEGSNTIGVSCVDTTPLANVGLSEVTFTVDLSAPPQLESLLVSPIEGENSLRLTWQASSAPDVATYRIYRSSFPFSSVLNATLISEGLHFTYLDSDLVSEETYHYAVTAVDAFNNENTSVVSVLGTVADTVIPDPIQNLLASLGNSSSSASAPSVQLIWNPSPSEDVTQYNIYRSTEHFVRADSLQHLGTVDSRGELLSYNDFSAADGVSYYYAVTPIDDAGNENFFVETVQVTLPDVSAPLIDTVYLGEKISGVVTLSAQVSDLGSGLSATSCAVCIEIIDGEQSAGCDFVPATATFVDGDTTGLCTFTFDATPYADRQLDYTFQVKDIAENVREGTVQTITIVNVNASVEKVLQLKSGWNLISMPVVPVSSGVGSVLSSVAFTRLYRYDTIRDSWDSYTPHRTVFDPENTLQVLEWGQGYWIHTDQEQSLVVFGAYPQDTSLHLYKGWNFVGSPYTETVNISAGLAPLAGAYDIVYSYNTERTRWELFRSVSSPLQPNTLTQLEPGKGYAIHMREERDWQP